MSREKSIEIDDLPYKSRSIWRILFTIPRVYMTRMTFGVFEKVNTKREIYYSTVFALSSAALAFLAQFATKDLDNKWVYLTCIISFGLAILVVILIHFFQTIFLISSKFYYERAEDEDMMEVLIGKVKVEKEVWHAVDEAMELMFYTAVLDFALLLLLLLGVVSYVAFLILGA